MALNAQHSVKLLQLLQAVTYQKANCLLALLKAVLLEFRPYSLSQVSCIQIPHSNPSPKMRLETITIVDPVSTKNMKQNIQVQSATWDWQPSD